MDIYIFVGTIAEFIKLFPIIKALEKNNLKFKIITSNQNDIKKSDLFPYISIKENEIIDISDFPKKQSVYSLFYWFLKTLFSGIFVLKKIIKKKSIFIIHGDTLSTLIGGILGKIFKAKIFHIEAGLRSFNLLRPFPEELTRVLVSFLADVSFCPNEWALENLKKRKCIKVNTFNNTLIESLLFAKKIEIESDILKRFPKNYFLCVIHRQENIYNKKLIVYLVKKIIDVCKNRTCVFILHQPTKIILDKFSLLKNLENNKNIFIVERLPYILFTKVLDKADFIITDGGSNQEESYYLGKPCLLLRKETERIEGLSKNVILSELKEEKINSFFNIFPSMSIKIDLKVEKMPSEIIVDFIKNYL